MRTLVDFLNHGALPFTGRKGELERLTRFWRDTPEANGLRALLLLGEAGIGKSRLIEELLPSVQHGGGLTVHTKLLPESTASIVPLIARALWYSETGRHLLKKEPEENLGSVLAALRRLARLRPTLLVIEDVHLLQGETVRELWQLLEGLADETLSLLCAARPVELPVRGLLERYLVEEIALEGLHEGDLRELWRQVFAGAPEREIVESLESATAGNPLAVRSALRGALASGAILQGEGTRPVRFDRGRFVSGLKRDIGLLTEGMAAHLSDDERRGAETLALLGEAFARESAGAILDDAGEAIERLIFRGILAVSATPRAPLVGARSEVPKFPASNHPLIAFSHTLVHRYFVDRAAPDPDRLIRIIGSDLPLYSLLPFQALDESSGEIHADPETIVNAVNRTRFVALELSNSPDKDAAEGIWKIADGLLERAGNLLSQENRRDLQIGLLVVKLSILALKGVDGEYEELARYLVETTANPQTAQEASRHLAALAKLRALDLYEPGLSRTMWRQAEELVERFGEICFTHSYGLYLALVMTVAVDQEDTETVRLVKGRLREIAEDPRGSELGRHMRGWILPSSLTVFESEGELGERLQVLEELEDSIEGSQQDLMLRVGKILLFDEIGDVDNLFRAVEQGLPKLKEYGWPSSHARGMATRIRGLAAIGMELAEVEAAVARALAETGEETLPNARSIFGAYLLQTGLLRGETEWGERILQEFPEGADLLDNGTTLLLALSRNQLPDSLPAPISERDRGWRGVETLLRLARGEESVEAARDAARAILARPPLRIADLVLLHGAIGLMERIRTSEESLAEMLREEIGTALGRTLEWMAMRRLPAHMSPLLERYESYYTPKELKSWRGRVTALCREREGELNSVRGDGRIRVSMLGTIAIHLPDGTTQRLQGARLRTVLGLMVANQMLETPLSGREFAAIATGEETPERARNVVYQKLHSLREILGPGGLVTETDQAPRLNTGGIQIDLLEACTLLEEARDAMREGALLRACPALLKALDLTHGEVPFPGLYEEFFEAAREDFENMLRSAVMAVSRGLLREEDPQRAEEIARRAFEAMPDDEEIGELLCEALARRGKRTEAERVRRKMAAEVIE